MEYDRNSRSINGLDRNTNRPASYDVELEAIGDSSSPIVVDILSEETFGVSGVRCSTTINDPSLGKGPYRNWTVCR